MLCSSECHVSQKASARCRSTPRDDVCCKRGHTLQYYVSSSPGRANTCDGCGRERIRAPEHVYRCEVCDYDLCQHCFAEGSRHRATSSTELTPRRLRRLGDIRYDSGNLQ